MLSHVSNERYWVGCFSWYYCVELCCKNFSFRSHIVRSYHPLGGTCASVLRHVGQYVSTRLNGFIIRNIHGNLRAYMGAIGILLNSVFILFELLST